MKFLGYGLIDKNKDVVYEGGGVLVNYTADGASLAHEYYEISHPDESPYKIVRVLIDEIEDDKKI